MSLSQEYSTKNKIKKKIQIQVKQIPDFCFLKSFLRDQINCKKCAGHMVKIISFSLQGTHWSFIGH